MAQPLPVRRLLAAHVVHELVPDRCVCGAALRQTGTDNTELLDIGASGWRLLRHVRARQHCDQCGTRAQATPPNPIPDVTATFSALAGIMMARYDQYHPLYRQVDALADCGIAMRRTTLASWIAKVATLLDEVAEEIRAHGLRAPVLSAANMQIEPARNERGRLWTYATSGPHPLIWYRFTPLRAGPNALKELAGFAGALQAGAHQSYDRLWKDGSAMQVGCWLTVRRRALDITRQKSSPLATEIASHAEALLKAEEPWRLGDPMLRMRARANHAIPILDTLRQRIDGAEFELIPHSPLSELVSEIRRDWDALTHFVTDGRIEIDCGFAENALRHHIASRHSWVFGGSREASARAATIYTIIETCKLNKANPLTYIASLLAQLTAQPRRNALAELMPWNRLRDG